MARPQGHALSAPAWEDVLKLTGMSQTKVAERAGVPRSTIAALLGGHNRASIPTAHRIAQALGVHPATLFPTLRSVESEVA